MLILEAKGKAKVAVWSEADGRLDEYGWVNLSELNGWSIYRFDWDEWQREFDEGLQATRDGTR